MKATGQLIGKAFRKVTIGKTMTSGAESRCYSAQTA